MRIARAIIDLNALRHNYREVRRFAPQSRIMCVIKANAYGHGMVEVAKALPQADGFAVACLDEALQLRSHGIRQPLTVFQGFQSTEDLQLCRRHGLWPVVHHASQLEMMAGEATTAAPLEVWLKIATGMNRLGFRPEDTAGAWERLRASGGVRRVRLMTHMARADEGRDGDTDPTALQLRLFDSVTAGLNAERSLANSAALIDWPDARRDWVRPGIMLYGVSPFLPGHGPRLDLKPVMTLRSRLIAINNRKSGEPIGYGGVWVCPRDMRVGAVAIGYGDGYPRHIETGTPVLVNGKRAPIVGRVSMDLLTVDLSASDAKVGDEVMLWGEGLPVDQMAVHADTIAYELLCSVYGRVNYEYEYRE
ncbi:MAG TPA: alanine racemase [Gammaproteobacteria bacterium]|nr:alanine racemase [Gammaproteobacteria bacterium]